MNLIEVNKNYNTQAKCLKLLKQIRWGKNVKCTFCDSKNVKTNKKEKEEYLSTNLNVEFSICCKNCGEKNYGKYTIIKKANINENID